MAAVRALERLGDPAAAPTLITALGQSDDEDDDYAYYPVNRAAPVRAAAAQALGTLNRSQGETYMGSG